MYIVTATFHFPLTFTTPMPKDHHCTLLPYKCQEILLPHQKQIAWLVPLFLSFFYNMLYKHVFPKIKLLTKMFHNIDSVNLDVCCFYSFLLLGKITFYINTSRILLFIGSRAIPASGSQLHCGNSCLLRCFAE